MDKNEKEKMIQKYIQSLNDSEKVAYEIAVRKLESSFDIEKSIGFIEFVKSIKDLNSF